MKHVGRIIRAYKEGNVVRFQTTAWTHRNSGIWRWEFKTRAKKLPAQIFIGTPCIN